MSNKPGTPVSSPRAPSKSVKLDPATPTSKNRKRFSSSLLKTPEQDLEPFPISPSLKRSNSGNLKSPDYKLNSQNISSPNAANLLKTPRHTGYESDDNDVPFKSKVQKTPQYFSPGRALFSEDYKESEALGEISSQLKSRLTSALGKVQQRKGQESKFKLNENAFAPDVSPLKKSKRDSMELSPSQRTNLNLQTLQQSPIPKGQSQSPTVYQYPLFSNSNSDLPTKSPLLDSDRVFHVPSPEEEDDSSAQNALMAALSRLKRRSRSSFSSGRSQRRSIIDTNGVNPEEREPLKLPPLNMALNSYRSPSKNADGTKIDGKDENNEKDAVLSLMSLSSPQSVNFSHSRNQSLTANSPSKSTFIGGSPRGTQLPPLGGPKANRNGKDNDATDVDDDATDDDNEEEDDN